jgi:hypothetical protein
MLEINWNQKHLRKCTLSFLSSALPEELNIPQKKYEGKLLDIQKKIFTNMALHHPYPTQKLRDYS